MVNRGRIHTELEKFLIISLNLIKSDNESVIQIGKIDIFRRGLKEKSMESKITQFGLDFAEKSSNEQSTFV